MKTINKIPAFVLAVCLLFSLSAPAMAVQPDVSISIDGSYLAFTQDSGSPFIDANNRTLVPLRITMESYGCEVLWDNENRNAIVYKDGVTVVCPIDASYIYVNGQTVTIDTAAIIAGDRTYLPIRCVLEAMGAQVGWDSSSYTVLISRGETDVFLHQDEYLARATAAIEANPYLTDSDASDMLAVTTQYLQNIVVDEAQISKMCQRLERVIVKQGALTSDTGWIETNDNRNYVITMDTVTPGRIPDDATYMEVLFHETCHLFSNLVLTDVWFEEGMTSLLTLSIAGDQTWTLYSYDIYLRIATALMEIVGRDTMMKAYLTGNQGLVTSELDRYAGTSNAKYILKNSAEQMTNAMVTGYFHWMNGYNEQQRPAAEQSFKAAATELTNLLKSAYLGKYGTASGSNPLVNAYLDILNTYSLVTTCRIISDPAFSSGTVYNYFGRGDYKSFFVLADYNKTYCEDGELIYYRYTA